MSGSFLQHIRYRIEQAVDAVMSDHTIALFSYEHRPYPEYDPRHVWSLFIGYHSIVS
jgi:hypothetical protein